MKRFWIVFAACCLLLSMFLFRPIDLTLEDLGRHLKNGEQVFQHPELLHKNFYSYSQLTFAFLNHHWLSGVVFYTIVSLSRIEVLTVLYATMIFAALLFALRRMNDRGGFIAIVLLAPFLTLFIGERHSVRPEGFGLLFLTYFLWSLDGVEKSRKISWRLISMLTLLELLWVNLHISFIFGLFIIGSHIVPECITWIKTRHFDQYAKSLLILLFSASAVSVLNPSGLRGALYPFHIFSSYGYDIVENKSIAFLYPRVYDPGIQLYIFFAAIVALCFITRLFIRQRRDIGELIRVLTGLVLGFTALRNLPIFAVLVFPFLAESLHIFLHRFHISKDTQLSIRMLGMILGGVTYIVILSMVGTSSYHPSIGVNNLDLGYVQHQFDAADFYKSLHLSGNMFNNYDIGSYLIYTQFPDHPVFVDNRPEAYSYDFFKKTYIPMQENDADWQKALTDYNFQSIFFGYHDLTPWGQSFIAARLIDPNWKLVYIDDLAMIWVRNTSEHAAVIAAHTVSPQDLAKYLKISR